MANAAFLDLAQLASGQDFQRRIGYAMAVAAAAVYSESGGTTGHAARALYATKVASGQYDVPAVALLVLGNSTIAAEEIASGPTNGIPDSDIQFAVNSLWNLLAGA